MKAIDAVKNLRALADLLEKHGEAEIWMASATVWVNEKEPFIALAKDMPKPFKKDYDSSPSSDLELNHGELCTNTQITIRIPRSKVCILKEPARPAVYDCPSIFSEAEEAELDAQ